MKTYLLYAIGAMLLFIVGYGFGVARENDGDFSKALRPVHQSNVSGKGLTNPLLECAELPEGISMGERISIQRSLEKKVREAVRSGVIADAAIYYRDLNNGPWFGVDEDHVFSPASLLKVPLAMAYLRWVESEPNLMNHTIELGGTMTSVQNGLPFKPQYKLEKEKSYTVNELLTAMLEESNNDAALALAAYAGTERVLATYKDFGQTPPSVNEDARIDVRSYASFFRILYNATYVDREAAEKILEHLARSSFKEGLVAGVPKDVVVAHKFGIREVEGETRQLHDCGIVYHPQTPYLLCMMTKGSDFMRMASFIASVSKEVYDGVSK